MPCAAAITGEQPLGTSVIYRRVVSAAHNGAIVIQHFGGRPRYQTLAALPDEIATLRAEGSRLSSRLPAPGARADLPLSGRLAEPFSSDAASLDLRAAAWWA